MIDRAPVVVVGASLAGLRAVETLRRRGYEDSIALIGGEPHLPYDRPPLSKAFLLDEQEPEQPFFRDEEQLDGLDVELQLDTWATGLDPHSRCVHTTRGNVGYDRLLIATGAAPNTMPGEGDGALAGVHTLRTLDDAREVREALDADARTVVVGAGFIGSEVASAARKRDLLVTMVETRPVPLTRSVGREVGQLLAGLHRDHGTDLRLGTGVVGFEGTDRVEGVRLTDGSVLPADLVVVGTGAHPATDWLESSGIALHPRDGGVVCDATLSTNIAGVFAAGDVAHWINPTFDRSMRLEHWTSCAEQAAVAAGNLIADIPTRYETVPYFWSDWYGSRIQFVGIPEADQTRIVADGSEDGRVLVLYRTGERLTGALSVDQPARIMKYRRMISSGTSWRDALEFAFGHATAGAA